MEVSFYVDFYEELEVYDVFKEGSCVLYLDVFI